MNFASALWKGLAGTVVMVHPAVQPCHGNTKHQLGDTVRAPAHWVRSQTSRRHTRATIVDRPSSEGRRFGGQSPPTRQLAMVGEGYTRSSNVLGRVLGCCDSSQKRSTIAPLTLPSLRPAPGIHSRQEGNPALRPNT